MSAGSRCARAASIVLAVVGLAACRSSTATGAGAPAAALRPSPLDTLTGYAGLYLSADSLVIMLVDTTRRDEAVAALRDVIAARRERIRHIVAHPARYSARELAGFKLRLIERGLYGQRLTGWGVSQKMNALFVGVAPGQDTAAVRRVLVTGGIPSDALVLAIMPPVDIGVPTVICHPGEGKRCP